MQTWVNFAAIKQSVPLALLLRRYQVKLRRSGRDQYRGCCPIHGGQGRDAFHANRTRNIFHCFSCGAGGSVLDFVAALDGCSLREAALKLAGEMAPVEPTTAPAGPKQLVTRKSKSRSPLGFTLRGVDSAHPYLAARGIAKATAERFGIGFYRGTGIFAGRVVIPIHNERGELVAYCGRALDPTQPRYRFPSGFTKSEFVFNLHRAAAAGQPMAVVVEGFFDCLKLHQAGVPAVALMGTTLYESQQRALLRHFRSLILMLDGDATGRCATATIAAQLRPHIPLRVIHLPDQVQPDQPTTDAVGELFPQRQAAPGPIC